MLLAYLEGHSFRVDIRMQFGSHYSFQMFDCHLVDSNKIFQCSLVYCFIFVPFACPTLTQPWFEKGVDCVCNV
jgi:hypothetical protein